MDASANNFSVNSDYTLNDTFIFDIYTNSLNINAPAIFESSVKIKDDVEIGCDNSSKTLTVKSQAKFINYVDFNTASGNFVLLSGSYIPNEVLRYTSVIQDLEKLADAMRRDYFYKHFYEWIGYSNK